MIFPGNRGSRRGQGQLAFQVVGGPTSRGAAAVSSAAATPAGRAVAARSAELRSRCLPPLPLPRLFTCHCITSFNVHGVSTTHGTCPPPLRPSPWWCSTCPCWASASPTSAPSSGERMRTRADSRFYSSSSLTAFRHQTSTAVSPLGRQRPLLHSCAGLLCTDTQASARRQPGALLPCCAAGPREHLLVLWVYSRGRPTLPALHLAHPTPSRPFHLPCLTPTYPPLLSPTPLCFVFHTPLAHPSLLPHSPTPPAPLQGHAGALPADRGDGCPGGQPRQLVPHQVSRGTAYGTAWHTWYYVALHGTAGQQFSVYCAVQCVAARCGAAPPPSHSAAPPG